MKNDQLPLLVKLDDQTVGEANEIDDVTRPRLSETRNRVSERLGHVPAWRRNLTPSVSSLSNAARPRKQHDRVAMHFVARASILTVVVFHQ